MMGGPANTGSDYLGWPAIVRIGLVQAAIGAVVVFTTSTLNRVMVVELGLAASVPGALVAFHYALQALRPRWGHGSDRTRRRTPWIVGGMIVLGAGGVLAGWATALAQQAQAPGLAMAVFAFLLIGLGVGAAGTALLTLLAERVHPDRRGPAAAIVWITMIAGFVVTTALVSIAISPFSMERLVEAACWVSAISVAVALLALTGLERGPVPQGGDMRARREATDWKQAVALVRADRQACGFAIFIFVSMLAFSGQDLILEPFAGLAFGLSPAATTALSSMHNGGVLAGMIAVALLARGEGRDRLRALTIAGCAGSAVGLALLTIAGLSAELFMLRAALVLMGLANGIYAAAAIALMMGLAHSGPGAGVRMGVWGAAQAVAMGGGGLAGALAADAMRLALGQPILAYVLVFCLEAVLFLLAPRVLPRLSTGIRRDAQPAMVTA